MVPTMLRIQLTTIGLFATLFAAAPALAQDAEAEEAASPAEAPAEAAASAPAEGEPAEPGEASEPAEAPAEVPVEAVAEPPAPAARRYPRPRAPSPIMVVVLPGDRVPESSTTAARDALVAQLTPLVTGRPVLPLHSEELQTALAACEDDACLGGQLAGARAQAGVILRLTRRGTRLDVSFEVRDPVSGTLRHEAPITGRIPRAAEELPAALQPLSAQLTSAMPPAPPRNPTLLVTTTADDALVTVDGEDIGSSPVGPIEIADGTHDVRVRLAGFSSFHTQTAVTPGEWARLDVTLNPLEGAAAAAAAAALNQGVGGEEEDLLSQWWFWTAIGGGAALLIIGAVVIGVVASQGPGMPDPDPMGIRLPPITGGM